MEYYPYAIDTYEDSVNGINYMFMVEYQTGASYNKFSIWDVTDYTNPTLGNRVEI